MAAEFSHRTRAQALESFKTREFDILVIGGGITGAAVAREAAYRGLSVALIERNDFAYGTSSRSSKLIHGGLRYLQNMEFGLVFEALAERSFLLKSAPHMVRPLPFYFPVYRGDRNGRGMLSLGLWLYDLLALFRAPGFHKKFSKKRLLADIPFLRADGLLGGFRYFDASMWDDALAIETLRSAYEAGAQVANYVEAVQPVWAGERISGYEARDTESGDRIAIRARQLIVCAGPWTDQIGAQLSPQWKRWIEPSQGVHLLFDLKRIPIPGAMVMSSPEDGRISFVIPRPDFGAGVVIVGTTDGPTPENPFTGTIRDSEVHYLLGLLNRYFPDLKLTTSDILSAYVGVRPLMGKEGGGGSQLQKVSREHHIDRGPGGAVIVAGGKYTTHRKMAEEIVGFSLRAWREDAAQGLRGPHPKLRPAGGTSQPVNPAALSDIGDASAGIPLELLRRYGGEAPGVWSLRQAGDQDGLPGFPALEAQLRFAIRNEMVIHLEDFYLRRVPLFASRADHGLPWLDLLVRVWAEERGLEAEAIAAEKARLLTEIRARMAWRGNGGV